MTSKPSRAVTRPRCATCGKKFIARRADARHCSGRCRQRANRARQANPDIDLEIAAARRHYWELIRRKAEALGEPVSQVVTAESQFVDEDGTVYRCGSHIGPHGPILGKTRPPRPGWTTWGLETAGAPFAPPPVGPKP